MTCLTTAVVAAAPPARVTGTPPVMVLQQGHSGGVICVAFAPDGKTLASLGSDDARLWDSRTGELRRVLPGMGDTVAFTRGGRQLAVGGPNGAVQLWDVATGELIRRFPRTPGGTFPGLTFALSPDGKTLARTGVCIKNRYDIMLYDVPTGKLRKTLTVHRSRIDALAFAPGGKLLASGDDDGSVLLWDIPAGQQRGRLKVDDPVYSLAFAPGGQHLAAGSHNRVVQVWNVSTQRLARRLTGLRVRNALAWSPDGGTLVAAGAADGPLKPNAPGASPTLRGAIKTWDARSWKPGPTQTGVPYPLVAVAFASDGHLAAGGARYPAESAHDGPQGAVMLWDARLRAQSESLSAWTPRWIATGQDADILTVEPSPNGRQVAIAFGGSAPAVGLLDLQTGRLRPAEMPKDVVIYIRSLVYSAAGDVLAGAASDGTVRLWDPASGTLRDTLVTHAAITTQIGFAPKGGRLVSCGADGVVRLWATEAGVLLASWSGHKGSVQQAIFAPDGKTVASAGDDGIIRIWNNLPTDDPTVPEKIPLRAFTPYSAAQLADPVKLYRERFTIPSIAYSPDGSLLVSGHCDGNVRLWESTGRLLRTLPDHHDIINYVAFAPDGKSFASSGHDGALRVWDTVGVKAGRTTPRHTVRGLAAGAYWPGGAAFYGIDAHGAGQIMDAKTGRPLVTFSALDMPRAATGAPGWIAWSPSGSYVASPGAERLIRWRAGASLLPAARFVARYRNPQFLQAVIPAR